MVLPELIAPGACLNNPGSNRLVGPLVRYEECHKLAPITLPPCTITQLVQGSRPYALVKVFYQVSCQKQPEGPQNRDPT